MLTQLCVAIYPEEVKNYINEQTEMYLQENPDNQAAKAVLSVIQGS